MVEWRNFAAERMVSASKSACFFQGQNVCRLFNQAQQLCCARWIQTYLADIGSSEKSAKMTGMNRLTRVADGTGNLFRLIASCAHHPKRNPLRRTRTHSRHLPQLRN